MKFQRILTCDEGTALISLTNDLTNILYSCSLINFIVNSPIKYQNLDVESYSNKFLLYDEKLFLQDCKLTIYTTSFNTIIIKLTNNSNPVKFSLVEDTLFQLAINILRHKI